jgi:hypothetical protein
MLTNENNLAGLEGDDMIRNVQKQFKQVLKSRQELLNDMQGIDNRESLFKYLNDRSAFRNTSHTFTTRVDKILNSLEDVASFIENFTSLQGTEYPRWKSILWGTTALILCVRRRKFCFKSWEQLWV